VAIKPSLKSPIAISAKLQEQMEEAEEKKDEKGYRSASTPKADSLAQQIGPEVYKGYGWA